MYFTEPVLFEVPVLPRVQKFIRAKLTNEAGQVMPMLVAPEALGPGLMLWAMAQSVKVHLYTNFNRFGLRRYDPAPLTATIGIGIQEFHSTRHEFLLNAAELWVFSNMVDYMIRDELVHFCDSKPSIKPMTRIKSFCDKYDFSEQDFSEGGFKQMYLRYRNQKNPSSFSVEVNRNFQFIPALLAA